MSTLEGVQSLAHERELKAKSGQKLQGALHSSENKKGDINRIVSLTQPELKGSEGFLSLSILHLLLLVSWLYSPPCMMKEKFILSSRIPNVFCFCYFECSTKQGVYFCFQLVDFHKITTLF